MPTIVMGEPDVMFSGAEIQKITNREMPDAAAESLALLATQAVRDYCGWRVAKRTLETIKLSPKRGRRTFFLPTLHLHAVTAVTIGGVAVAVDDIDWDQDGTLEVHGRYHWPDRRRAVEITIDHGHEHTPGGIAQAIAAAVARGALVPAGGIASETAIGQSYVYSRMSAGGLVAGAMFVRDELDRLEPYRIPVSR
ncbi:MAG: hypothetical protein FJW64_04990 [Actinobacteria bacterium]|nr:hypothetical protein [Actinomycetota bacterium]